MARFTAILFTIATALAAATASPVPAALEERASAVFSGRGTWYNTGLGACEWVNNDNERVVAISGSISNYKSYCGDTVTITNTANKKKVTAKVVDMCPSCDSGSLDLSPAAFKAIGNLDTGVLAIRWQFN